MGAIVTHYPAHRRRPVRARGSHRSPRDSTASMIARRSPGRSVHLRTSQAPHTRRARKEWAVRCTTRMSLPWPGTNVTRAACRTDGTPRSTAIRPRGHISGCVGLRSKSQPRGKRGDEGGNRGRAFRGAARAGKPCREPVEPTVRRHGTSRRGSRDQLRAARSGCKEHGGSYDWGHHEGAATKPRDALRKPEAHALAGPRPSPRAREVGVAVQVPLPPMRRSSWGLVAGTLASENTVRNRTPRPAHRASDRLRQPSRPVRAADTPRIGARGTKHPHPGRPRSQPPQRTFPFSP